jgi:hypothetical protein
MATKDLSAKVDEEIFEKLTLWSDEIHIDVDAIVNEALKHYLSGRVSNCGTWDSQTGKVVHAAVK